MKSAQLEADGDLERRRRQAAEADFERMARLIPAMEQGAAIYQAHRTNSQPGDHAPTISCKERKQATRPDPGAWVSKALKPAELRAFADEHLAYVIEMLFAAVRTRDVRLLSDDPSLLSFFHNARVEAFVSHLRTLIGFLFPDVYRPKRNDITARHYVQAPGRRGQWEDWRGPLSDAMRSAKDRADKEVSHLIDRRIAGIPSEKGWVMEPLANELREILLRFVAAAEPERLGERVSALVPGAPL